MLESEPEHGHGHGHGTRAWPPSGTLEVRRSEGPSDSQHEGGGVSYGGCSPACKPAGIERAAQTIKTF